MNYENQSLRNRIKNLASSLKTYMSQRNLTASKLAQEILNHHGYRRQFTHKLKGLKKGEPLPPVIGLC